MNRIATYLKQVIDALDTDIATKSEVYDELYDHLQMSKQSYVENGFSEEEAESRAIYDFGQSRAIGSKLQMSMFPAKFIVKIVGWCTFVLYTLFLILNTLIWTSQRTDWYQRLFEPGNIAHPYNFTPFKTIGHFLIQHESYNFRVFTSNTVCPVSSGKYHHWSFSYCVCND
ncbi:permease prefix domain 1-containing protein [Cohnella sp. 56]|uniref:permease prefix domain 1-containing protein n=1 Tax=Cohnella sp. 56 TaxID=3113722 RepID=UPI0030E861C3